MEAIIFLLIVCVLYLLWHTHQLHKLFDKHLHATEDQSKVIERLSKITADNLTLLYGIIKKHLEKQHGIIIENKKDGDTEC